MSENEPIGRESINAVYYAYRGMQKIPITADSVIVETPDGIEVELQFRRSDGEISLSINGRMLILPYATNVVRIRRDKD